MQDSTVLIVQSRVLIFSRSAAGGVEKRSFWGHPRPRQRTPSSALLLEARVMQSVLLLAAAKGDVLCTPNSLYLIGLLN
jgi:hypothetical protein